MLFSSVSSALGCSGLAVVETAVSGGAILLRRLLNLFLYWHLPTSSSNRCRQCLRLLVQLVQSMSLSQEAIEVADRVWGQNRTCRLQGQFRGYSSLPIGALLSGQLAQLTRVGKGLGVCSRA